MANVELEEDFSEVSMHDPASINLSEPQGQPIGISVSGTPNQPLVVLDRYSPWCIPPWTGAMP